MQMQMKELQLKEQELQMKAQIEQAKIQADKEIAIMDNQTKLQIQGAKDKQEGFKVGFDAVKEYVMKDGERAHGREEKQKDRDHSAAQERGRSV
jgi:hypothetical protein